MSLVFMEEVKRNNRSVFNPLFSFACWNEMEVNSQEWLGRGHAKEMTKFVKNIILGSHASI